MEWVLVPVLSAIVAAVLGRAKGSSFWIWLLVGLCLPVIGPIAALLYRDEGGEPERRCPKCGAVQKIHVQVCSRCGEDLYLPDPSEVRRPAPRRAAR